MSKKPKPRPRVRVAEPAWNTSVEGVLQQALKLHAEHRYTEIVVVAVRRINDARETPIDTLTFTRDKFRIVGILKWALDRLLHAQ